MARLSENFTVAEGTKSQTALRLGIKNQPNDSELEAMKLVAANILEPVRACFDIPYAPTSFFRCKELNDAVGSNDKSQHRKGEAADIEVPGVSNYALACWIRDSLNFDQLILEHYTPGDPSSGWVHVSYAAKGNRQEVLTFDGKHYMPGLVA